MADRIEKQVVLPAPVSRVWRAITDYREFGSWFRVCLEGPFEAGQISRGNVTYPGYEHLRWEALITVMEPERRFAYTWHPFAIDANVDYSAEPQTLVEFELKPSPEGCVLRITESGFDALPTHRRDEALKANDGGWSIQLTNIAEYIARPS